MSTRLNSQTTFCPFSLIIAFALLGLQGQAENWPVWRGPRGDGTSLEKKVPTRWSATDNVAWKSNLPGVGHASPIVWSDRVFTVTALLDKEERALLCLDRKTGQIFVRGDQHLKTEADGMENGARTFLSARRGSAGRLGGHECPRSVLVAAPPRQELSRLFVVHPAGLSVRLRIRSQTWNSLAVKSSRRRDRRRGRAGHRRVVGAEILDQNGVEISIGFGVVLQFIAELVHQQHARLFVIRHELVQFFDLPADEGHLPQQKDAPAATQNQEHDQNQAESNQE
jgi:hypothetical protein